MSDSDRREREETTRVRVNDRRRFDPDGTVREEEASAAEQAQAPGPDPRDEELTGLRRELESAHRRIDELARAIQAGERDREQFKQRLTREREQLLDVERGSVARTLLEAVDELDRVLRNAPDDDPVGKGVRLIRDGVLARAQSAGVERVVLVGQPYDPNLAEAVDMEVTPHAEDDNKVVEELQPAYRLKERVIRPGRVKVARFVKPADA